jgi:hypothetical protein
LVVSDAGLPLGTGGICGRSVIGRWKAEGLNNDTMVFQRLKFYSKSHIFRELAAVNYLAVLWNDQAQPPVIDRWCFGFWGVHHASEPMAMKAVPLL